MAQTSIHLRPCKQSSEIHNKREKELDYVRKELTPLNEWWSAVDSLGRVRTDIARMVKDLTGRKMQAKAEPLREGVIVIQEGTTMEQLKELGKRFKERFGVTPLQISIHRDEGHWHGDEWKPNLHAHIVFDWYNHSTGKSVKTTKADAAEMQTITAEALGMERGVSSDKKHVEARRFKTKAVQEELEQSKKELETLASTKTKVKEGLKGLRDGVKQGVSDLFTGKARERAEEAEKRALEAENRAEEEWTRACKARGHLKDVQEEANRLIEGYKDEYARKAKEMEEWKIKKAKDIAHVESIQYMLEAERAANKDLKRQLVAMRTKHQNHLEDIQKQENAKVLKTKSFMEDAASLGLTAMQSFTLYSTGTLQVEKLDANEEYGGVCQGDGSPWHLKFVDEIRIFHQNIWMTAKEWTRRIIDYLESRSRQQEEPQRTRGMRR